MSSDRSQCTTCEAGKTSAAKATECNICSVEGAHTTDNINCVQCGDVSVTKYLPI